MFQRVSTGRTTQTASQSIPHHSNHSIHLLATSPAFAHHPKTHSRHYDDVMGNLEIRVSLLIRNINIIASALFQLIIIIHHVLMPFVIFHSRIYQLPWIGIETRVSSISALHYVLSVGLADNVSFHCFHLYPISRYKSFIQKNK